ncbi:6217_t:CDS:1, partial [Acaulospora morrowiae]
ANERLVEVIVDREVTDMIPQLIEILTDHCPNVSYIKIFLRDVEKIKLLFSRIASSKLKKLVIRTNGVDATEILPSLSKLVPLSLYQLDMDVRISPNSLQSFLNNCEAPIKTLIMTFGRVGDEHMEVLMKYALERKSLKSFGFMYESGWGELKVSEEVENRAKEIFDLPDLFDPNDFYFQYSDNEVDDSGW